MTLGANIVAVRSPIGLLTDFAITFTVTSINPSEIGLSLAKNEHNNTM